MTTTKLSQANGPTPPLTPKKNSLSLREFVVEPLPLYHDILLTHRPALGSGVALARPNIHREQSLLRLQHQLDSQPSSLMKHSLLSRIRREDPELFFSALQADLVNL